MISALAKYIFGGIVGDAPETTPMQFETREVNDWLLVDMPDQAIDNEDLDSETDDDEILTAVPLLLTEDNLVCDSYYGEISYDTEYTANNHSEVWSVCNEDDMLRKLGQLVPHTANVNTDKTPTECSEDFQILPESLYVNQSFYYPCDFSVVMSQIRNGFQVHVRAPEQSFVHVVIPKENKSKSRNTTGRTTPLPVSTDKRINHPAAYSKNFINHRSPALPPKTALLEQIKELKPIQRAIEYDSKKYLTRSQMNRQNRNYIYESSVKTNRRRNLQRNHSGANNNRKC